MIGMLGKTGRASDRIMSVDLGNKDYYEIRTPENMLIYQTTVLKDEIL